LNYVRNQTGQPPLFFDTYVFGAFGLDIQSCPTINQVMFNRTNEVYGAKVVAAMTPSQREQMANGGLPFSSLTKVQQDLWEDYYYRKIGGIPYRPLPIQPQRGERWSLFEPTVVFENGLPNNLILVDEIAPSFAYYFKKSATERALWHQFELITSASDGDQKLFGSNPNNLPCYPAQSYKHVIDLKQGDEVLTSIWLYDYRVIGKQVDSWQKVRG
jgi:hypothetical protein